MIWAQHRVWYIVMAGNSTVMAAWRNGLWWSHRSGTGIRRWRLCGLCQCKAPRGLFICVHSLETFKTHSTSVYFPELPLACQQPKHRAWYRGGPLECYCHSDLDAEIVSDMTSGGTTFKGASMSHPSLSTSLLSGPAKYFWLIWYLPCPGPGISHFSTELFSRECNLHTRIWVLGVFVARLAQQTEPRWVCAVLHAVLCVDLCVGCDLSGKYCLHHWLSSGFPHLELLWK